MKATLTKNIKIKTAIAYLVFEKEQERPDIVKFIKGEEFDNDIINNRVKEYLRKLHILENNGSPTRKGSKILESGKIFIREEGKYKIWFIENDSFTGTKILYFERVSPRKGSVVNELKVKFEEENYFLPVNNDEFSFIKLVERKNIIGEEIKNSGKIDFVWEWNNLESSNFHFSGKIDNNSIKDHKINSDEDLGSYISNIFTDWDYQNQRLKVEFTNLRNDNEKRNFKTNYHITNQAGFQNIKFTDIPIMPYDKHDAKKWRDWFIEREIEKQYFLKYDFEKLVNQINSKEGFSAYENDLDFPEISKFRDNIYNKDKSRQSLAFWHLSAPDDLNPDKDIKYTKDTIKYKPGEEISFRDIGKKLKDNTEHKINAVFYYDKYVNNQMQQRAMKAFFESIDTEKNYLITNLNSKNIKRAKILSNSFIEEIDLRDIFTKDKPMHDRYIIFAENKNKYSIWRLSNSIDYIKFQPNHDITPDTLGKMNDNIVFLKVEKELIKTDFITFIENKL